MNLFYVAWLSLIVAFSVMTFGSKIFAYFGVLDNPKKYGFDREAVPYSMGFFGCISFLILTLFFLDLSWQVGLILVASSLLVLTCFLDDRIGLSPFIRLVIQILAATIVVLGGTQILVVSNPFESGAVFELGLIGLIFSVFWIVSLTNLVNFLDGVSGLSSGVSSVGFLILLMLSILPGMHSTDQSLVQVMSLILFVIAFVSFLFEFPSPKFLIGDSGTMFFGFMLAVLSMLNGGKLATAALVLLIPLFDGAWVILRRIFIGKSPFSGDFGHLHHRLERIGFSKQAILFTYIGISFLFGLIAVFVWNTFFKVVSLLLLLSALSIIGYLIWIKETK